MMSVEDFVFRLKALENKATQICGSRKCKPFLVPAYYNDDDDHDDADDDITC